SVMTLRNKLLINFAIVIFFILISFGFSAYHATYKNAAIKDKQFLERLIRIDAQQYERVIHNGESLNKVIKYLYEHSVDGHLCMIIDKDFHLLNRDNIHSPMLELFSKTQIMALLEKVENSGEITIDEESFIWAKMALKNTEYNILYIDNAISYGDKSLKDLSSRLFVIALIILWIAAWIVIIIANRITKKINIQQKEIEYQATHDAVTGLVNRRYFIGQVDALIKDNKPESIGIITIGFNRFREINDGLGYAFGDRLLSAFAKRLNDEFWQRDIVASFGGDQFALLLPIKKAAHWSDVVEKVKIILSVPFTIQDINIFVDVSMGISIYPDNGKDSLSLIKCSEIAMHSAKKTGLFFECYNVDNDPNNIDRLELISELSYAIERNEFELYYQPKVDIKDHCLTGAEALIRWKNPKRGFVRPDIFIELAEQGRIIKDITNWVIEEALRQCSVWHKNNRMYFISINISAC
ncbi:MAG: diguanylate cyclase, partial [Gammaproteobacteria bacterium]|nr:diguanylate cyclase [Gammaproteobacteria bacterium]